MPYVAGLLRLGKSKEPPPKWYRQADDTVVSAYIFRGKIGKKVTIENRILTLDFLAEIDGLKKNYRTVDADKISKIWGKVIDEEISMFATFLKLKL